MHTMNESTTELRAVMDRLDNIIRVQVPDWPYADDVYNRQLFMLLRKRHDVRLEIDLREAAESEAPHA